MSSGKHVCVIGAGIVGASSAYALARQGWRVTLVDAHSVPGEGAVSYTHLTLPTKA